MTEATAGADEAGADVPDERRVALADQLRRLTVSVVADRIPPAVLDRAVADVAAVADTVEAASTGRRLRLPPDPARGAGLVFPTSPVIGPVNPVAPPVWLWTEAGAVAGDAYFDLPYEGPPSCVHGGVIAMLFDELLGVANMVAGRPAMTGTLTVRYRRPTPLRRHLRVWARCLGGQGRKVHTEGAIVDDGEVTAEAKGLFVAPRPELVRDLLAEHGAEPAPGPAPSGATTHGGEPPAGTDSL